MRPKVVVDSVWTGLGASMLLVLAVRVHDGTAWEWGEFVVAVMAVFGTIFAAGGACLLLFDLWPSREKAECRRAREDLVP